MGEISESLISFDCFLIHTGFSERGSSTYYFKVLLITILPIILMIIFFSILTLVNIVRKRSIKMIHKQLIVSLVVIIYSLHPTLTRMSTSLFYCMELDRGESWLLEDLEIRCWSYDHIKWSFGLGLTSIIFWTLLMPLTAF